MKHSDHDFQSIQEIGKIYQSITDKKVLCGFFLESVLKFIRARDGYLFMTGKNNRIWMEATTVLELTEAPQDLEKAAMEVLAEGKPSLQKGRMFLPLVIRNAPIGVSVFTAGDGDEGFDQGSLDVALSLSAQLAGALKNILLFEENLKMERLAAVGQTIGMVIHEIKNIMQLAQLSFDFIERGAQENNQSFMDRGMSRMKRALREMGGFAQDMLSLTKDYRLSAGPVDLKEIVDHLREDLTDKALSWEVRLDFDIEEGFPAVEADGKALYRALLNLIKNAMEASDSQKQDSFIRLRIHSLDENAYEIVIEDNGVGMTAEVKARVFESFFSTKGSRGTGLGLMIVQKTVHMHQGKLSIDSELGKGTTFHLKLPKKINESA